MTVSQVLRTRVLAGVCALGAGIAGASLPLPAVAVAALPAGRYLVATTGTGLDDVARQLGVVPTRTYASAVTGFSARLTAKQATALAADPAVLSLRPDATVTGMSQTVPPAVTRIDADEPPVLAGDGGGSVDDVAVAVLDSGVEAHNDYNLAGGTSCVDDGNNSYTDYNGHGTGVSGVIGAKDNAAGIVGVAPGARIYSVRVLDSKLRGTTASLVCGLDWVAANAAAYGIKVVNLSLGTAGTDDGNCGRTNGDLLHQAVCAVTAAGVTVVASAGNDHNDIARIVPAAYDEVLAVTNVADFDGRPGGVGTAPCPTPERDDTAAGTSSFAVTAADAAHTVAGLGTCPFTTKKGNRYGYIQPGTSMAAASVAGVVLDCVHAGGPCAGRTPADVIRTLIAYAAREAAQNAHGFTGDPLHPAPGRYYGYLLSTRLTGAVPAMPATDVPAPPTPPAPGGTMPVPGSPAPSEPPPASTGSMRTSASVTASAGTVVLGQKLRLRGAVRNANGAPTSASQVLVDVAFGGAPWRQAAAVRVARGSWTLVVKPAANAAYRVRFVGDAHEAPSTSRAVKIQVRAGISVAADHSRVTAGTRVVVAGTVAPKTAARRVTLQRQSGRRWLTVAKSATTSSGRYAFRVAVRSAVAYRVVASPDSGHVINASATVRLAVATSRQRPARSR